MANSDEFLLDGCQPFLYLLQSVGLHIEQISVKDMNGEIGGVS